MAGYIGSKAAVVSSGAERKKTFDITTSTTSLTGLSYTVGQVHVFHNGVRLVDGTDYTATNGTSITLTAAAENGDQVVVVSYATFQTSDTVSASAGGTFSNAITSTAAGTALNLDRTGSDGAILDLKKDGSTVGSIGILSSRMSIGTGDVGLFFNDQIDQIQPINTTTNAPRDNAISLGASDRRFKDLYLSGGVYLGGTGSANKLDDYEEGTFTPSLEFAGVSTGITYTDREGAYTKIGRLVTCQIRMSLSNNGTATTGAAQFEGLPFQVSNVMSTTSVQGGSVLGFIDGFGSSYTVAMMHPWEGTTTARIYYKSAADTGYMQNVAGPAQITNGFDCRLTLQYFTDA